MTRVRDLPCWRTLTSEDSVLMGQCSGSIELERFVSFALARRCMYPFLVELWANQSVSCAFEADPDPSRNDQLTRAAALIRSSVTFSQAIREDRLPLDEFRGTPQCMNQYWWLFGVARVPADDGGRIRLDPDARHIVVLCRGQAYRLLVLEENTGRVINEISLRRSLSAIVHDANCVPIQDASKTAVGLLTTENQKVWSRCRRTLVHEGLKNGQNFAIIDSSLFVLCLDDSSPSDMTAVSKNMICGTDVVEHGVQMGTCVNRWYDKLSVIVCRNGAAGMNFEHTCSDGSVDIGMACQIYEGSLKSSEPASSHPNGSALNSENKTLEHGGSSDVDAAPSGWQKLNWDIPTSISDAIHLAEQRLVDRIRRHQVETLDFRDYGKSTITSMGFSPDAFFEMALQAAYYRVYGQVRSGFEPVQMRQYLHGRTDVVRTTTAEAATFARLFSDAQASSADKMEAMHRATEAHVAISKDCAQGRSHHRHLYVLQQLWKRRRAFLEAAGLLLPTPPPPPPSSDQPHPQQQQHNDPDPRLHAPATTIFTDAGWSRLGTTILMGSNVDNASIAYAGFGPPSEEGFTVCYFIRRDFIRMSVCSRNGQARRFAQGIEDALREIRKVFVTATATTTTEN